MFAKSILTQELYDSEDDYIMFFSIKLLAGACQTKAQNEVITHGLDLIHSVVKDGVVELKEEHKEFAKNQLQIWRVTLLKDFSRAFGIPIEQEFVEFKVSN